MNVIIVGSGPSGVHFAQTALERGHKVTVIDVGKTNGTPPQADLSYVGLKRCMPDPTRYFLGDDYEGAQIPMPSDGAEENYYNIPAAKNHVFDRPRRFSYREQGLSAFHSFAAGGLAEAWTAGAYAFNDDDLREFPFGYQEIAPFYAKVAERIGVAGARDDLSTHHPLHEQLSEPIDLDDSGMRLMASYEARRDRLVRRHGIRMGRSRQAALAKALGDRQGCRLCGRCLWGCPNGALYTPSLTLQGLYGSDNFTYLPGHFASHFTCSDSATIDALVTYPEDGGGKMLHYADVFVLACGTIGSSNLFLRTLFERTGDIVRLPGLMDNRQILAPFFNLAMLGRRSDPDSYQYHQLTLGLENEDPSRFVHGQITTFTTGDTHPLISQLPLDLKSSTSIVGALRSGLCVVNLNFADDRREGNALTLDADRRDEFGWPTLVARYAPAPGESASLTETLKRVRRFLWNLRAPLIPGMARVRPMGASAHYSGTLPMSAQRRELTVSANGQSHDFDNLFVVDGSIFPFLPAKNLTFTLMANATRIAANAF